MNLLAYLPEERWAYVHANTLTLLVRPGHADMEVLARDVFYAVLLHGWVGTERVFRSREDLLRFLEEESIRSARRFELPSWKAVLAAVGPEDLDRQIERAAAKIRTGDRSAACHLLRCLLEAPALTPLQTQRIQSLLACNS